MNITHNYHHIFSKIKETIESKKRPMIIGVSGAYTAGKTLFTQYLSKYLNENNIKTQVVHYDDFHQPLTSLTWQEGNVQEEVDVFYNHAFNADRLLKDILSPLSENHYLKGIIKGLNWETGRYEHDIPIDIDKDTVVIIEGMLLFRSPVIAYLDYKIFLNTEENEILERAKARDVPKAGIEILEKYQSRYLPVLRRYLSEDNPIKLSDLVIYNNDFKKPVIV